jgi:hypothetical protein
MTRRDEQIAAINDEVKRRICAMFSIDDQIQLLRTAPSAEFEVFNEHAEACRDWGRKEKRRLGLID